MNTDASRFLRLEPLATTMPSYLWIEQNTEIGKNESRGV